MRVIKKRERRFTSWCGVFDDGVYDRMEEGRCKDTWKKKFKLPWSPPNRVDDKVNSDQWVVNKELSFYGEDLGYGLGEWG